MHVRAVSTSTPERGLPAVAAEPARFVRAEPCLRAVRWATTLSRMENELVKRVMWSGLLTVVGGVASILTQRTAAYVWRRMFDEEPPE